MFKHTLIGALIIVGTSLKVMAQDGQFSQFYNLPTYLNSSLVGSGAEHYRGTMHGRWQWPSLSESSSLLQLYSIEKSINDINSGVGVTYLKENIGFGQSKRQSIYGQYAYSFELSKKLSVRAGLMGGAIIHSIGGDFLFPDEFDDMGLSTGVGSESIGGGNLIVPDFGAGSIVFSDHGWVGVDVKHLNRPDLTVLGAEDRLPMTWSIQLGTTIDLSETKYNRYIHDKMRRNLFPVANYKSQGASDQFDVGFYGMYDALVAGIFYRGIIFKRYETNIQNNESVIFLIGFNYKAIHFSYSYDAVVSTLTVANPRGAHEITLNLAPMLPHKWDRRKKPMKSLPCPAFIPIEVWH